MCMGLFALNHQGKEARLWTPEVRAALPEGDEDTQDHTAVGVQCLYVCACFDPL